MGPPAAAADAAAAEAGPAEETSRRHLWLEAIHEVTVALLGTVGRDAALELVAGRTRDVAGVALCCIALPADAVTLVVEAAAGPEAEAVRGLTVSRTGPLWRAYAGAGPVQVADVGDSLGVGSGLYGPALVVPLTVDGAPHGVLVAARLRGEPPLRAAEVSLVQAFAGQAALALGRARAQADRERLAIAEDHNRIARDLHDLVIQRLFASGLSLQGLQRLVDLPAVTERLEEVMSDLDDTVRDIRRTIFCLKAPPDGRDGLRAQVLAVLAHATPGLGVRPKVRLDGPLDADVPADVAGHLVAVLREALSNVARHARARRVEVTVRVAADHVLLVVEDDGVGLGEPSLRSGLANIEDRAEAVGGTACVGPAAARGTRVSWSAPL